MYLRPGNLYKDFTVEKKDRTVSSRGRAKSGYSDDGVTIRGILAEAKPQEKERWRQL